MQKKDIIISWILYSLIFIFVFTIGTSILIVTFFGVKNLLNNNILSLIISIILSGITIKLLNFIYTKNLSVEKEFSIKVLVFIYFVIFSFLAFYFNFYKDILISATISLAIGISVWNSFYIH